jgi:hypothetical protein
MRNVDSEVPQLLLTTKQAPFGCLSLRTPIAACEKNGAKRSHRQYLGPRLRERWLPLGAKREGGQDPAYQGSSLHAASIEGPLGFASTTRKYDQRAP